MIWLIVGICVLVLAGVLALAIMAETRYYPPDPTHDPSAIKERPDDY